MRHILIASSLVLATAFTPALAQTKKDLAQRVIKAQQTSIEGVASGLAGGTSQQVLESVGMALGNVPKDKQEATAKAIQGDVKKFYDDIEPVLRASANRVAPATIGVILEEKFTEDELRQLASWFENPLSKKYSQLSGDMQESLTKQLVADTRGDVEGKLKALEGSIRAKLEAAGAKASGGAEPAPKKKK